MTIFFSNKVQIPIIFVHLLQLLSASKIKKQAPDQQQTEESFFKTEYPYFKNSNYEDFNLRQFSTLSSASSSFSSKNSQNSKVRHLGRYIKNYHPLTYDSNALHLDHLRVRRNAEEQNDGGNRKKRDIDVSSFEKPALQTLELKFQAKERQFHLKLAPDNSIFTNDFTQMVHKPDTPENRDSKTNILQFEESLESLNNNAVNHIYYGHIHGEGPNNSDSWVHGSIIDGVLQHAMIKTKENGTYYIDHVKEHFTNDLNISPNFHSIIYHESDVLYPNEIDGHERNCMDHSPTVPEEWLKYPPADEIVAEEDEQEKETENEAQEKPNSNSTKSRQKRQIYRPGGSWASSRQRYDLEKTTCVLGIEVDYFYYKHYNNREEVMAAVAGHVRAISDIYRTTPFRLPGSGEVFQGINFQVKRVVIHDKQDRSSPFFRKNIGVERFLEIASESNFDLFCLHYVFTKRDFDNGVLGLAWVAQPRASVGGICEKHRTIPGSGQKSMNTGIITIENYGSSVPSRVSHITFAHEVGHNFGSPHDSGLECTPGENKRFRSTNNGNFIMYSRATSGLKSNNKLFSDCSKRNISAVLEVKSSCFIQSDAPICGNGIVDKPNEECDCGFADDCAARRDNCCVPAGSQIPGEKECTLYKQYRNGRSVQCSPSQGPCCSENCQFKSSQTICAQEMDCRNAQTCAGNSYECLPGTAKPDKTTLCALKTQTCKGGECIGSICEYYNLAPCTCTPLDEKDKDIYCHTCCMSIDPNTGIGDPETCDSTGSQRWEQYFQGHIINLQPGSPCDNFAGYCDVFSKCRLVDADGPLRRLRKVIFNIKVYEDIRDFIYDYWWAVLLLCLALVLLMAGFIQICSIHTPTHNPKLQPHQHLYDSLRRRRTHDAHRRQHNVGRRDHYTEDQDDYRYDSRNRNYQDSRFS